MIVSKYRSYIRTDILTILGGILFSLLIIAVIWWAEARLNIFVRIPFTDYLSVILFVGILGFWITRRIRGIRGTLYNQLSSV